MHEAGLLAAAVAEALAADGPSEPMGPGGGGARRPVTLEIRVHDPMHVAPESARLHAELALRARGFNGVEIIVSADPVTCVLCDVANVVSAEHPFCNACGWPLPDRGGHAVDAVVRWADGRSASDPAAGPPAGSAAGSPAGTAAGSAAVAPAGSPGPVPA